MPQRKKMDKRRVTDDYKDATAAMQNKGDDPYAMVAEGEGNSFPSMGGATPGAGLSDELIQRLAHMMSQGRLSMEELQSILMARASLPEVLGG